MDARELKIIDQLGQGGMGSVFRALHLPSGREVALKVVRPGDATRSRRLAREGELAARLHHPGIVPVLGVGLDEAAGQVFVAFELVPAARPLDGVLAELPRARRLELLLQVARALAHAHAHGVVHRDVKPQNVLVDASGRARLTDFGLATATDQERLTRTGALLGTPSWMSPEQARGEHERIGAPSDVWALGVMLHEALTDRHPLLPPGEPTLVELVQRLSRAGPPRSPCELDPTIPPALGRVVQRALEPDPAARWPHAGQLAAALGEALRPDRRRTGPGLGIPLALLGLIAAAAVLLVWLTRDPSAPAASSASPASPASAAAPVPVPMELAREFVGKDGAALEPLERRLAGVPDELAHRTWRALSLLERGRWRFGAGSAAAERALRLARTPLERAQALRDTGDLEQAMEQAALALVANPQGKAATLVLGEGALTRLDQEGRLGPDDRRGALESIRLALAGAPEDAEGWLVLAVQLAILGDGGAEEAERACRLAPGCPATWQRAGWVLWRGGRIREALAALDRSLELEPGCLEARNQRARVRWELGDRAGALADLERTLAEAPAGTDLRELEQTLREWRGS